MTHPPAAAPPVEGRIVVDGLTKVFGSKIRAVDQLSFTVEPGSVTGFLGPNGAGKTTTLRMVLGLVRPTAGNATIGGRPYSTIRDPLSMVGAALESSSFHPARTGRNHLRIMCIAAGIPERRADEVLAFVDLAGAARRKVRGYSLGMRQRLALAAALIGDPRILILDEPANGLDPDGIRWLRGFFRMLADQGRTVLVSSHQLGEVEEFADRVVILNRGRLVRAGSIAELTAGTDAVHVRSPSGDTLAAALAEQGMSAERVDSSTIRVRNAAPEQVGHIAFVNGVELHELSAQRFDLEHLFFALTQQAAAPSPGGPPPGYLPPGYLPPGNPPPGYAPPGYLPPGNPPVGPDQGGAPWDG